VLGRGYIIACQPKLRPTRSVLDSGRPLRVPTTSWSITYLESDMALACLWLSFDSSYAFCSSMFVELEWTTSATAECRPRDVGLGRTKTFEEPTTELVQREHCKHNNNNSNNHNHLQCTKSYRAAPNYKESLSHDESQHSQQDSTRPKKGQELMNTPYTRCAKRRYAIYGEAFQQIHTFCRCMVL